MCAHVCISHRIVILLESSETVSPSLSDGDTATLTSSKSSSDSSSSDSIGREKIINSTSIG